jgi:hypothetical protein
MPDPKNATASPTDAEIILKLYDLRRESEMRKARNFCSMEFLPRTWEEYQRVVFAFETNENRHLRQVLSYWDMACSLVLAGALNEHLFFLNNGEMFALYARIKPYLKQTREAFNMPEFAANIERVIEGSAEARERLQRMEQNMVRWREMREQQQAKKQGASEAA